MRSNQWRQVEKSVSRLMGSQFLLLLKPQEFDSFQDTIFESASINQLESQGQSSSWFQFEMYSDEKSEWFLMNKIYCNLGDNQSGSINYYQRWDTKIKITMLFQWIISIFFRQQLIVPKSNLFIHQIQQFVIPIMRHSKAKQNCPHHCNASVAAMNYKQLDDGLKESSPFIRPSKNKIIIPHLLVQSSQKCQQAANLQRQPKQLRYDQFCSKQSTTINGRQLGSFQQYGNQQYSDQVINSSNRLNCFSNLSINHQRDKNIRTIKQDQMQHKKHTNHSHQQHANHSYIQYPQLFVSQRNCQLAKQHKQNLKKDIERAIKSIRKSQGSIQSILIEEYKKIKPNNKARNQRKSYQNSLQNGTKISTLNSIQKNNSISSQDLYCSLQRLRKIDKLQNIISKIITNSDELQSEQAQIEQICNVQNTFAQQQYAQQLFRQIVDNLEYNIRVKNQYISRLEAKVQTMGLAIRQYLETHRESSPQNQSLQNSIRQSAKHSRISLENSIQFDQLNFKQANLLDRSKWDQVNLLFNQPNVMFENMNCLPKEKQQQHSFGKKSLQRQKYVCLGIQSFPILTERNFLTDRINQQKKQKFRKQMGYEKAFEIFMINQIDIKDKKSCKQSFTETNNISQSANNSSEIRQQYVQTQVNLCKYDFQKANSVQNFGTKNKQNLQSLAFVFMKKYKLLVKLFIDFVKKCSVYGQKRKQNKNLCCFLKQVTNSFNQEYYRLKQNIRKMPNNIEMSCQLFFDDFNIKLEECLKLHQKQLRN